MRKSATASMLGALLATGQLVARSPFILGLAMAIVLVASSARAEAPEASAEPSAGPAPAKETDAASPSAADILERLKRGNDAFASGRATHPHQDASRLLEVAQGQKPAVTFLSCSDSRVPVEVLFDQGIGDVFTVRVAGNVADTDELGTIEYGVDHLETPLLVVLGHTKCGAVTAVATGAKVHGHIPELVDNIAPAVSAVKAKSPEADPKTWVEPAIVANVFQSMADIIQKSEPVRARLKAGKVKIVGGVYSLDDGRVSWLGEHPDQAALLEKGESTPEPAEREGEKKRKKKRRGSHAFGAEPSAHAEASAPGEEGEKEKPAGPPPNLPVAFAIVALIASAAGAASMKLASR